MLQHFRQVPLLHHLHPRLSSSLSFSARYLLILPDKYSALTHRSFRNSSSRGIVRFRARTFCTATAEQAKAHGGEDDYFFANDGITWKSLGISDRVTWALSDAGLHRPSLVQVVHINCLMKCSSSLALFVWFKLLHCGNWNLDIIFCGLSLLVYHVRSGISSSF
jgi:hypothetical protein